MPLGRLLKSGEGFGPAIFSGSEDNAVVAVLGRFDEGKRPGRNSDFIHSYFVHGSWQVLVV
jgi:hypothetical protein